MTIEEAYQQMEEMHETVEEIWRFLDKDEVERSEYDDIKLEEYLNES